MKKILVCVDFSDVTELVLEKAKSFAKAFHAELKIIHVVTPIPRVGVPQETAGGIIVVPLNYEVLRNDLATELKSEHNKMLDIKKHLSDEKVKAKAFLLEGKIADVILSQVDEYTPDIIIMGSHGHGCVVKALLGSITMSVLKHVQCPVVIIPHKAKYENK